MSDGLMGGDLHDGLRQSLPPSYRRVANFPAALSLFLVPQAQTDPVGANVDGGCCRYGSTPRAA
jgi:hypothetical protein